MPSFDLLQDVTAILAALILLPWTFSFALFFSVVDAFSSVRTSRIEQQASPNHGTPSRILLSGAGSPVALSLARLLQSHGHTVIGVDYETIPLVSPARLSNAYTRFYRLSTPLRPQDRKTISKAVRFGRFGRLTHPAVQTAMKGPSTEELYAADIVAVMQHETLDLWIPCEQTGSSSISSKSAPFKSLQRARSAVLDAGKRCICPTDDMAALSRSPVAFADFVNALHMPVRAPLAMLMHSRDDVHRTLAKVPPAMRFVLEKVHRAVELQRTPTNSPLMLTHTRGGSSSGSSGGKITPPRRPSCDASSATEIITVSMDQRNAAYNAVATLPICEHSPWLLREDSPGPRLVASALVLNGRVRAFVASQPSLSHAHLLTTLPPSAPLYPSMLHFTQQFARYQTHAGALHVSITFAACSVPTECGEETRVMVLGCDASVHGSMALLMSDEYAGKALARVYAEIAATATGAATAEQNERGDAIVRVGRTTTTTGLRTSYVRMVSVLGAMVMQAMAGKRGAGEVLEECVDVVRAMLTMRDEGFERADPWPWWYVVHVQEPAGLAWVVFARLRQKIRIFRTMIS
ncbi:hypothetical protein EJ05DRAFT_477429 [Pseudovirgaria hyperparasitica]|uniref:Uncharacterized protein n=1 Tax=Pseudovirgaria hyperparasitica TaxID=470096 RepID=A0A6A6W5A2_9PEZI|nr:uncharacterized protein EJ05DRAFT_477429 [Pseudovirgaria hyperparasitica]KAF2757214.1 hypothetical protein EJ05DRAFT_477429 [Pseudovirgaria hyperparasitica]